MEPGILKVRSQADLYRIFIFEFIGTAIFLLGINFSNGRTEVVVFYIYTASLLVGRVSGAHFNMAVTLSIYLVERKWREYLPVALVTASASIAGAYTGILIAYVIKGYEDVAILKPGTETYPILAVLFSEMVFSSILCLSVLYAKYGLAPSKDGLTVLTGVIIVIYGLISASGPYTGACLNPTVGITLTTFYAMVATAED